MEVLMTTRAVTRAAQANVPAARHVAAKRGLFEPFAFLQNEIDRVFDSLNGDYALGTVAPPFWPSMDVREDDGSLEIQAELPGMKESDIDISFRDGYLVIRGDKKTDMENKSANYRMYERLYGAFERSLRLPEGTEPSKIRAKLVNGVLHVSVPKPAGSKGQKIEVSRG
jgi:HSP20 family protein